MWAIFLSKLLHKLIMKHLISNNENRNLMQLSRKHKKCTHFLLLQTAK